MSASNSVWAPCILVGCTLVNVVHGQATNSVAQKPVYIEFQRDGKTCKVRDAAIDCEKVLPHLRQVLNLPPGSEVRFKAGRSVPFPIVKRVMDEVQHSEYATATAYILPPKPERKP